MTRKYSVSASLHLGTHLLKLGGQIGKWCLLGLVVYHVLVAAWSVLHGDIKFHTDIARDFLLLYEIEVKKIMLIGPRAGAQGLFHGPLWPYLNFPVYYLSKGNPVASGWFWIGILVLFFISSFVIARKLFNDTTAYIYLVLISFFAMFRAREFTHPDAAMVVMPMYFYSVWKYTQSLKVKYLIFAVLTAGVIIQFEVASGAPFFLMSLLYILYKQIRYKKLVHVFAFTLILVPLSTYIMFDLRHEFFQFNNLLIYIKGKPDDVYVPFQNIVWNRIDYLLNVGVPVLKGNNYRRIQEVLSVVLLLGLIATTLLDKRRRTQNAFFLYLFFGYFLVSLSNRYYLALHHFLPFTPIVFMFVSSLALSRFKLLFCLLFVFIIVHNSLTGLRFIDEQNRFIGKNEDSWNFLAHLVKNVYQEAPNEFGYFVYAPDKFAYEPKYAMIFGQKQYPHKQAFYFSKQPVTYVVLAPPPPDNPYMLGDFWTKHGIHINKVPEEHIEYPNGYIVEKYTLTEVEQRVPFDKAEDSGLHFR